MLRPRSLVLKNPFFLSAARHFTPRRSFDTARPVTSVLVLRPYPRPFALVEAHQHTPNPSTVLFCN